MGKARDEMRRPGEEGRRRALWTADVGVGLPAKTEWGGRGQKNGENQDQRPAFLSGAKNPRCGDHSHIVRAILFQQANFPGQLSSLGDDARSSGLGVTPGEGLTACGWWEVRGKAWKQRV